MKKFRITERGNDDFKSAHYIYCNKCEQINPFTVKIENSFYITFMDEVIKVEEAFEEVFEEEDNSKNMVCTKCNKAKDMITLKLCIPAKEPLETDTVINVVKEQICSVSPINNNVMQVVTLIGTFYITIEEFDAKL